MTRTRFAILDTQCVDDGMDVAVMGGIRSG